MSKPGRNSDFLRRDRAMKCLSWLEQMVTEGDPQFPSIAKVLHEMVHDDAMLLVGERLNKEGDVVARVFRPRVEAKIKAQIAQSLMRVVAMRDRALDEMGLSRVGPKVVENHAHFTQVNLTVEEFQQLPEPIREKLMLTQLAAVAQPLPNGAPDV